MVARIQLPRGGRGGCCSDEEAATDEDGDVDDDDVEEDAVSPGSQFYNPCESVGCMAIQLVSQNPHLALAYASYMYSITHTPDIGYYSPLMILM